MGRLMKNQRPHTREHALGGDDHLLVSFTRICDSIISGSDVGPGISEFQKLLSGICGVNSISLYMLDEHTGDFELVTGSGSNHHRPAIISKDGDEPLASLSKLREPIHLYGKSPEFAGIKKKLLVGDGVESIDVFPLEYRSKPLGFLVASFSSELGPQGDHGRSTKILEAAASQLSITLHSRNLNTRYETLREKYASALSEISSAIFILDPRSGRILEANEAFFRSFGYEPSDIGTLTLFDMVTEPRSVVEANLKKGLEEGRVHIPSKLYKHKSGGEVEVEIKGKNITFGGSTFCLVNAVDLTEKRKAQEETEHQRRRYENFIQNSAEGIWRIEFTEPISVRGENREIAKQITEKGVVVECNQALAEMYGFDRPDQLIGRHSLEFIADVEGFIASKMRFTEQNFSITNIETKEKDKFGNIHYFENSYIGEVSANHLVRIWGIQRDVTEKRRLQEQLRASEIRYRNLVEQANDMVLLFNNRGEFVFANKRFFEMTHYAADEIWGKPISMLVHPDSASDVMQKIQELFLSPEQHLRHTVRLLTRFNEERVAELSMTTLRAADKVTGILAIGRDVTQEQSVRNALHESEEKYRSLVEHSLFGVLVLQNEKIVFANQTLSSLFEMDLSSLQGASIDSFVHPNDYVQLSGKFAEVASTPNTDVRFNLRIMTPSGSMKMLEGWAAAISYMGKPAIQAAVVDVTDTKRLEEQLIQSQKMESIGQLASGIAHDFNNLLGSIYGALEILRRRYGASDQNLKKYIDILDGSAQRAAELTSQLLMFSRQRESNIKPVRMNDTVNDTMKILTRSIGKNIKIESALDPTLFTIEADTSQLESVILNLSINSRDAMPSGGTLRIETSNMEFDQRITHQIADAKPGNYACLSVSDTGIGMDEETQRKIFEPFFTTKPLGKGTGLGLSIVYGIVKNHRGFINVYSEPGRGTTFRIYLPATDKLPVDEATVTSKEVPHGNETILLIDDELTLLDLTREILEGLGYRVMIAEGALEGIRIYKDNRSDVNLVILDMLMPEMTGTEVYPILKNINPDINVLLATGLNVGEKVEDLLAMGVTDVVGKPYSISDLAVHVRHALDGSR